jgi:hypothetical protein
MEIISFCLEHLCRRSVIHFFPALFQEARSIEKKPSSSYSILTVMANAEYAASCHIQALFQTSQTDIVHPKTFYVDLP